MRTWTLMLVLLGTVTAHARTDHAAVVAAMKTEQQQCRYYLQRCEAGDIDGISSVQQTMQAINGHRPVCFDECNAKIRALLDARRR